MEAAFVRDPDDLLRGFEDVDAAGIGRVVAVEGDEEEEGSECELGG
jgi:hypothetical protein